jgi:hypothetical protein
MREFGFMTTSTAHLNGRSGGSHFNYNSGGHTLATQQGAEEITQHRQGHGVEAQAEADVTSLGTDGMGGNRAETERTLQEHVVATKRRRYFPHRSRGQSGIKKASV